MTASFFPCPFYSLQLKQQRSYIFTPPFPNCTDTYLQRGRTRERGGVREQPPPPSVRSCPSCPNKLWHVTHIRLFPCSVCVFSNVSFADPIPPAERQRKGGKLLRTSLSPPSPPSVEIEWGDWISRFAAKFSRIYGL